MSPTQQSALEALVGRPLSDQEVAMATARQDDSELAASLSVGLRPVLGSVPSSTFLAWTVQNKMRSVIQDKSTATGDSLRDSALAMLDLIVSRIDLDLSSSAVGVGNHKVIDAWVTAGLIDAEQRDSLIALATVAAPPITVQQVNAALGS